MSLVTICCSFAAILIAAHALGFVFSRIRQPRVIGEIVGGAILGSLVGTAFVPDLSAIIGREANGSAAVVSDAAYSVGLVTLMFLSGAGMKRLLVPQDRAAVSWLAGIGTAVPFVLVVMIAPFIPMDSIRGDAAGRVPIVLVLGIAAAVTSIPVISRIFRDLGVLHTRFARLIVGIAVVEDVALWPLLAMATALATSSNLPVTTVAWRLGITSAYLVIVLAVAPRFVRALQLHSRNQLARRWPLSWMLSILVVYSIAARVCGVSLMFGAFFAGLALASETAEVKRALGTFERVAYAIPIPVYFALVGLRLELRTGFSLIAVAVIIAAACTVKLSSVALGGWLAGFRGIDLVNIAVATNARGGPGIVLASAAYDARIVNGSGYTALVLLAMVTSQAAGAWLEMMLRRNGRLLSADDRVPRNDARSRREATCG